MDERDDELDLTGFDRSQAIGVGATATVYRALQSDLGRFVAIKVFDRSAWALDESDHRFFDECVMAGRMSDHPNAMTVYQAGRRPDGVPYIVMELCPNGTLWSHTKSTPVEVADLAAIGVRVCGALITAHLRGITHRDVKPSNIVFNVSDEPVLTDFGIGALDLVPHHNATSFTPGFAAPELTRGESGTPAADVYGWCSTFSFLLTGRLPHDDATAVGSTTAAHSPDLERLLAAGTDRSAQNRPDMSEVLDAMVIECRRHGVELAPIVLPPESSPAVEEGPESFTLISELPTAPPLSASTSTRSRGRIATAAVIAGAVIAAVGWIAFRPEDHVVSSTRSGPRTVVSTTHVATPNIGLLGHPAGFVDVSSRLASKVESVFPPGGGPYPYDAPATESTYFPRGSDFPVLGALPSRAVWSFHNPTHLPRCQQQNPKLTMTGFAGHIRAVGGHALVEVAAIQFGSVADAHTFFTDRALSLGASREECEVDHRGTVTEVTHRSMTPPFSVPLDEYNCWTFAGPTRQPQQLEQVAFACSARRGNLEAEVRVGFFADAAGNQSEAEATIVTAMNTIAG